MASAARARRDVLLAQHVPYTAHVAESVLKTRFGDYIQLFQLAGVSFESADDVQLNAWHERLNVLWRNIASPQVALWTHVIRRRAVTCVTPNSSGAFADALIAKYRRHLAREILMENALFLAIVFRPTAGLAAGMLSGLLSRAQHSAPALELRDALDACEKLEQTLKASLSRYDPEVLGVYRVNGKLYSRALEFLRLLLDSETPPVPMPRAPLNEALGSGRLLFGSETLEYRLPSSQRVGAILGVKEYATPSIVGMYDRLLSAPFSFVLTQSFAFLSKAAGQGLLQRQFNRMANAGDFAISQAEELKLALDALTSNEFVIGDHHLSLQIIAELPEPTVSQPAEMRLKPLNDAVALARSLLADTGMTVAREDLALEAAFWAQLPGFFAMRPRKAPITSRNFAAMAPFHNYPCGREHGNYWGDALALLVTSARSPYHLSLHASDPSQADGGSRRDTGHTLICGPTGSGKTVFIGFLVSVLSARGVTQIIFDKDRGLEILIRALGGEYLSLKNGSPTGFNPLRLPRSADNEEFLKVWLGALCGGPAAKSVREQADLDQALRGTLALDPEARRLSRLVEFLDPTDPNGLHARLSRWCVAAAGDYGWVFDNADDVVVPRVSRNTIVGFDVTDFLAHDAIRTPVTLYLFHLVRRALDGRPLVCWMDEFWRLVADPAFQGFAKDGPKTWRKLNAVMCLATQSASDVLESPVSRTIVEQTATKILFPNADALEEEYIRGFGLSEREFKLIKEQLLSGSRQFLVKQGAHSVVCQLDLRGFEAELKVISGRASSIERMEQAIARFGGAVAQWLPQFMSEGD